MGNNGSGTATNVLVTNSLQPGVVVAAMPWNCSTPAGATTPVTCWLGSIGAHTSASVTVPVRINTVGSVLNSVTASSGQGDPVGQNNSYSGWTSVAPRADLSVALTQSANPVTVGSALTYTLTVTNHGPSMATGITATATFPSVRVDSHSGGCTYDPASTRLTCNATNMPVNGTATAIVNTTTAVSGGITAYASVTGNGVDPVGANNVPPATFATVNRLSCPAPNRPRVSLSPAPSGDGRLRVLVSVGTDWQPSNRLEIISFTGAANGLIDILGVMTGRPTPFSAVYIDRRGQTEFLVRRASSGASTVGLEVRDNCGTWPTFVGGGPSAF